MKKKIYACLALSLLLSVATSCKNNDDEPEPAPDPIPENPMPDPETDPIDLSLDGMANCYIVQSPGRYMFPADNQFNLGEGLPVPPIIDPQGAALVWQSKIDQISSVDFTVVEGTPYIFFDVKNASGNALIAATDAEGNIIWSWHIWMPEEEVTSYSLETGYEVMNMNLGALNNDPGKVSSYGLLYQWGRKDPFPASPTILGTTETVGAAIYDINNRQLKIENSNWANTDNNTLEYSIAHPTVCLSNYSQYSDSRDWLRAEFSDDNLWGNTNGELKGEGNTYANKGQKTCYDPSPAGWRVAPPDAFITFTSTGGYAWQFVDFNIADINGDGLLDLNDYNYGWHFNINDTESMYFPAAARYDGSYAMLMGSVSGIWGNYWSNSPNSSMSGGAICALAFQVKDQNGQEMITASVSAISSRADAFSIRCVRDN